MLENGLRGRALKRRVWDLLRSSNLDKALDELSQLPLRRVVNPLFSLLYSEDEEIKWRSVTAMGLIVSIIASNDMESARTVMRRLMWNLNDESGGIGWGSPEAMGEIMACQEELADEYAHILVSYIREDGNYLDQQLLQRGVIWGLGRLAQVRPHILQSRDATRFISPYLRSSDATIRALAAWTMGFLGAKISRSEIERLLTDDTEVRLYVYRRLAVCSLSEITREALYLARS